MLSNVQVEDLAKRMGVKLEAVCFKSELKDMKLKYNVGYIINLENEFDEWQIVAGGSAWRFCITLTYFKDGL